MENDLLKQTKSICQICLLGRSVERLLRGDLAVFYDTADAILDVLSILQHRQIYSPTVDIQQRQMTLAYNLENCSLFVWITNANTSTHSALVW